MALDTSVIPYYKPLFVVSMVLYAVTLFLIGSVPHWVIDISFSISFLMLLYIIICSFVGKRIKQGIYLSIGFVALGLVWLWLRVHF